MNKLNIDFDNLTQYPIKVLAKWLRSGVISTHDLVKQAIENHEQAPPKWNAYATWDPKQAMHQTRSVRDAFKDGFDYGMLQGIPVSVKDNYGIGTYPLYAGSSKQLPNYMNYAGPVLKAIQKSLGIIMGKTNTVEFAYGGLGVNNHWGTPWNPFDSKEHRVPGGSSCGAGVSLHEGSAMLALGSDTAGSVRIPASFTGNVGYKPSKGRWSTDGIVPLSQHLDVPGILTKSTADLFCAFSSIDPQYDSYQKLCHQFENLANKKVRIGIGDNLLWSSAESDIVRICEESLHHFESFNVAKIIHNVKFPEAQQAVDFRNSGGTVSVELIEFMQAELPEWIDNLDPIIANRVKIGGGIDAIEFLKRIRQLRKFAKNPSTAFEQCDLIACPTVPISPPKVSDVSQIENYQKVNLFALQNTCIANILNLCATTIPVGLDAKGMPVGLQLLAPHGYDELLVSITDRLYKCLHSNDLNDE